MLRPGSVGLWAQRGRRREGPATEHWARPRDRQPRPGLGVGRLLGEGGEGRREGRHLHGLQGRGAGAGNPGHWSPVAFAFSYKVEEKVHSRRPVG